MGWDSLAYAASIAVAADAAAAAFAAVAAVDDAATDNCSDCHKHIAPIAQSGSGFLNPHIQCTPDTNIKK